MDEVQVLVERLTDSSVDDSVKLETIKSLKGFYGRKLGNVRLESLLSHAGNILDEFSAVMEDEFLVECGTRLADHLNGTDKSLRGPILGRVASILSELGKRKEGVGDDLTMRTWTRLRESGTDSSDAARALSSTSKTSFERLTLSCATDPDALNFCARTCSNSPDMFQAVTSILNEVLVGSEGSESVLQLVRSFVAGVEVACLDNRRHFLSLYPGDCRRLVTLLMVSPDHYPDDPCKTVNRGVVLKLIFDLYKSSRRKALLLLSHYPAWIPHFNDYLMANVNDLG